MAAMGIFPYKENSHGRTGDRTWGLMASSQKFWTPNHEAGHNKAMSHVRILYAVGADRSAQFATVIHQM
jgi:hypothetical protein